MAIYNLVTDRVEDIPRNRLTGDSLYLWDFRISRDFRSRKLRLDLMVDAFTLNRPNVDEVTSASRRGGFLRIRSDAYPI